MPTPRFLSPFHRSILACLFLAGFSQTLATREITDFADLFSPAHQYYTRPLNDPFTKIKGDLESGKIPLDNQSGKAFVISLLKACNISASSQMLAFSTTSLQLSKISPRNPRALYFNEDLYVSYVPGGKIEIVSLDPQLGGIFYIFEVPKDNSPPKPERTTQCMNCHAAADTRHVPGLVIKSVIPGPNGGSLDAFRRSITGHDIPLEQRFGGWYLTGSVPIKDHWGNTIGKLSPAGLSRRTIRPGELFSFDRYPYTSSNILPQLIHEHQAGFVNRVVEAGYKYRSYMFQDKGKLSSAHTEEMRNITKLLTRYLLFADEAPLPDSKIEGDSQYKTDFLASRKPLASGESLKDLDLRTHLFKYRCSYMIYGSVFQGLPSEYKNQILQSLYKALDTKSPDPDYSYLPAGEKRTIKELLKTTLPK